MSPLEVFFDDESDDDLVADVSDFDEPELSDDASEGVSDDLVEESEALLVDEALEDRASFR